MAEATVTFGAKDINLAATLDKLKKEVGATDEAAKKAGEGFKLSFGKIGIAAGVAGAAVKAGMMAIEAATAAARSVIDGFGQAINLGGRLNDLSSRTGETAGNLLLLERSFENAGVGADKVGPSINRLQKFIGEASAGGKQQIQTFDALGISMSDLEGKTPTDQMQLLATRISGIADPTERAKAAMDVFGRSGGELLPLLNNFSGELNTAQRQLGSLPGVMDRANAAFDKVSDNLGAIGNKTKEFAAGFLERALPALNAFTTALAGVDAAGWGQRLMDMVIRVADTLLGAFKQPKAAIDLLTSALMAGLKTAGNNFLNSVLTVADIATKLFQSSLPGIVAGVLGNTLIKTFVDAAKALIDNLNKAIRAFEEFLGSAIENVVKFFASKFTSVINAFAEDFKAAMSDPIGFVTGKLDSALGAVMKGGGNTFQASFDQASGNVLDKVSAGLGAVSSEYGEKIIEGTAAATGEFQKVIQSIEPSARDFFGATEAVEEMKTKFKDVEEVGKNFREQMTESKDEAAKVESAAVSVAQAGTSFEQSITNAAKELSLSAKLMEDISKAQAKEAVDRGGRLEKRAQEQIAAGQFKAAARTAQRIGQSETRAAIREQAGGGIKSMSDIGRQLGLSMKPGETGTEFEGRIAEKMGIEGPPDSLKPSGKQGRTGREAKDEKAQSPLEKLVTQIHDLVKKIEPKLPQQALA
jgi:hypothetical protein